MTARAGKKPITAPVPARAVLDRSLTHLDIRVLLKICSHDRMSILKAGQGCLVSTKTMAQALGVHQTSVATSASRLITKGYIVSEKRTEDKRGRTYRVIYNDDDDRAVRNAEIKPKSDDEFGLSLQETINAKSFLQTANVVSCELKITNDFQCNAEHKHKEGENADETGKYSVETARLRRGLNHETTTLTAEVLRNLDYDIKQKMAGYPDDVVEGLVDWCADTYEHYCNKNNEIAQWANRLQDEIALIIEERS